MPEAWSIVDAMPAKNHVDPSSRRQRVLAYYKENPGLHRCKDVGAALGEPTHPVAVASRTLYLQGKLERHLITTPGKSYPVTKYTYANGTDPAEEN